MRIYGLILVVVLMSTSVTGCAGITAATIAQSIMTSFAIDGASYVVTGDTLTNNFFNSLKKDYTEHEENILNNVEQHPMGSTYSLGYNQPIYFEYK